MGRLCPIRPLRPIFIFSFFPFFSWSIQPSDSPMSIDPIFQKSLDRAVEALMSKRDPRGFWEGRLASSPLATAVSLCAFAGGDFPEDKRAAALASLEKTQDA